MQYLLTEDEMEQIRLNAANLQKIPCGGRDLVVALENVCKMVADTMIPTERSSFQDRSLSDGRKPVFRDPYGCIHGSNERKYGYCDLCPVQGICPMPKSWSK